MDSAEQSGTANEKGQQEMAIRRKRSAVNQNARAGSHNVLVLNCLVNMACFMQLNYILHVGCVWAVQGHSLSMKNVV